MATIDRTHVRLVHSAPPPMPVDWNIPRQPAPKPVDPAALIRLARRLERSFLCALAGFALGYVVSRLIGWHA